MVLLPSSEMGGVTMHLNRLGVLTTSFCLVLSSALAAGGTWKYGSEDRGHPQLIYSENGKNIFMVGCGRAFAIHAVYPGTPKKDDEKATITIANAKTRMTFEGEIDSASGADDPPNTTHFLQWDLGYKRQDPELFGKKWKRLEVALS